MNTIAQYAVWKSKTFTGGQQPNANAIRSKLYELSLELQDAHQKTVAAQRIATEADQTHLGGPLAPYNLIETVKVAAKQERGIYRALRKQVLAT